MCAIVCGKSIGVTDNDLQKSLEAVKHRGPDSLKIQKIDNVFLSHARLSIVDISGGVQPLWNEDKSIIAVVNGEFYDYAVTKESLLKKGHVFKTNSDSELLIHLYEEYKEKCLDHLNGEFAFVLFDRKTRSWFCARDRMGSKPLQFYHKEGMFLIASEAKSLMQFENVKTAFDKDSYWFAQHTQYLPLDKTLFKNISMVKPGHFFVYNEKDKEIVQKAYWSLKSICNNTDTFEEAIEKTKDLLSNAVRKRIPSEVKWATHLSGGIDSSLVTALAAKFSEGVSAFTVKFTDDPFYDESELAAETAKYLGIGHIVVPVSFSDMIKAIPSAVRHAEGLSINGHLGAKYLLNKEIAKKGFKVALSGEGSDEIFMGYSHLKQDYLSVNSLKPMEKQYLTGFQLPDKNYLDVSSANVNGFVPTWLKAKASMAFKFKQLWHKNFTSDINPYHEMLQDLTGYSSYLKAASGSWFNYCMAGYILKVLDDAQSMAHSVEGRLPFLDKDLMEYVFGLKDSIYFHNGVEKGILREGFKDFLPKEVIEKTKQSFMSPPVNRFLANKEFKNLLSEYVFENKKLKDQELFDIEKIYFLLNDSSSKENNALEPIVMTTLCTGVILKDLV